MPLATSATLSGVLIGGSAWTLGERHPLPYYQATLQFTSGGKTYEYRLIIDDLTVTRAAYPDLFSKLDRDSVTQPGDTSHTFVAYRDFGETDMTILPPRLLAEGQPYIRVK